MGGGRGRWTVLSTAVRGLASSTVSTHILSTFPNACRQGSQRRTTASRDSGRVAAVSPSRWAGYILPRTLTKSRMSWSTSGSGSGASRSGGERERLDGSLLSARLGLGIGGRPAPSSRPCASAMYPEAGSPRVPVSGLRDRRSPASSRRRRLRACDCANSSCQRRRNSSRLCSSILDDPGPTRHPGGPAANGLSVSRKCRTLTGNFRDRGS